MNAVGMCALLGVAAGAGGPAASAPENRPMALTLLVPESNATPDLEAFLSERAHETWGAVPGEAPTEFAVAIAWPSEQQLVVLVREAGRELARREIEVADPGATKLTVWLVVKSTINRALLERDPGEDEQIEIAALAEPKPAQEERIAEKEEPAVEPPPAPALARWAVGAFLSASVSRLDLLSVGPTLLVWLNPWRRLVITLEAGYRISPTVWVGGSYLEIHHVPVTVTAGWQLNPLRTWSGGVFATSDLKIPVADSGSGLVAGMDLGGYLQAHAVLTDHSRFFARLFIGVRASRVRFIVDDGSLTEGPVVGGIGLGVLWQ